MADALNHALTSHGYAPRSHQELATRVGPPLEGTLAELTGQHSEKHLMSLISSYRDHYLGGAYRDNTLYPGIRQVLRQLLEHGHVLGVCTSKPEPTARKVLDFFGLESMFRFVSGGDVGLDKSSQLERLLDQGQVDQRALMIGDRAVDIQAARDNGLHSAGVRWGFGAAGELQQAGASYLLDTPRHLLQWLDSRTDDPGSGMIRRQTGGSQPGDEGAPG